MTSVGLVLGAGGVVGAAYHAGTLAALAELTGWDPRTASVVVGTSAGSSVGAVLRAGLTPADQLARVLGEPMSAEGEALVAGIPPVADLPLRPARPRGLPRPQAPHLITRGLGWPFRRDRPRPAAALAGLLPAGTQATNVIGDRLRALYRGQRWPDRPLWICALRLRDGARVVFGRDPVDVADIGQACEASSAIPGFFRPVRIGNDNFVDGGVWSPTNADVLTGLELDAVVVISPMSATASSRRWRGPGRGLAGANLGAEVRRLRAEGTPVLTIQPAGADIAVMGANAMDFRRREAVARQAYESGGGLRDRDSDVIPILKAAV